MQDVEEEEEGGVGEQKVETLAVREKIREALEVGVRRMNLNAAAGAVASSGGVKETAAAVVSSRRELLESRIKQVDRLQSQIEQTFRSVKKELMKGSCQGGATSFHVPPSRHTSLSFHCIPFHYSFFSFFPVLPPLHVPILLVYSPPPSFAFIPPNSMYTIIFP